MEEAILFPVVSQGKDSTAQLIVDLDEDVFRLVLNGKEIMSGNYKENLAVVMERALAIWK